MTECKTVSLLPSDKGRPFRYGIKTVQRISGNPQNQKLPIYNSPQTHPALSLTAPNH